MEQTGGLKCILVIEHEGSLCKLITGELEGLGHHPITASNGLEGFATLARANVEGVVMDLDMPMMNGLTMLRRLRDQYPTIPVLILSGHASREVYGPLAGMKKLDYLLKPFHFHELKQRCLQLFS